MDMDQWSTDWDAFAASHWNPDRYLPLQREVVTIELPTGFVDRFPKLSSLLSRARRYEFVAKGNAFVPPDPYSMLAWTSRKRRILGWICYPVIPMPQQDVPPLADHRLLLTGFGGIEVYWNNPPGLISNLDHGTFRSKAACNGFGGREDLFHSIAKTRRPKRKILPADYYVFAVYPNGDALAYHQITGEVILIGFDAGEKRLINSEDYPNLIYTLDGAADFHAWVESLADEYLDQLS